MKIISSQLQSSIEAGKIAYIISVTMKDGTTIRYTNHDRPLVVDGFTYTPGAALERIKMVVKGDSEVSTQEFESAWTVDINEEKALNGYYDDAQVVFSWVDWENPQHGALEVFRGNLGLLTWTQEGFQAEVHNAIRKLQNPISTYYTPFCRHNFGDTSESIPSIPGGCNVNLTSYTFTGSVSTILTNRRKFVFTGPAATQPDTYFSFGVLTFTNGLNNGRKCDVKIHTVDSYGSQIEFYLPTVFEIQVGDTFSVVKGCDKSREMCKVHNNVTNFGGFPDLNTEINFR